MNDTKIDISAKKLADADRVVRQLIKITGLPEPGAGKDYDPRIYGPQIQAVLIQAENAIIQQNTTRADVIIDPVSREQKLKPEAAKKVEGLFHEQIAKALKGGNQSVSPGEIAEAKSLVEAFVDSANTLTVAYLAGDAPKSGAPKTQPKADPKSADPKPSEPAKPSPAAVKSAMDDLYKLRQGLGLPPIKREDFKYDAASRQEIADGLDKVMAGRRNFYLEQRHPMSDDLGLILEPDSFWSRMPESPTDDWIRNTTASELTDTMVGKDKPSSERIAVSNDFKNILKRFDGDIKTLDAAFDITPAPDKAAVAAATKHYMDVARAIGMKLPVVFEYGPDSAKKLADALKEFAGAAEVGKDGTIKFDQEQQQIMARNLGLRTNGVISFEQMQQGGKIVDGIKASIEVLNRTLIKDKPEPAVWIQDTPGRPVAQNPHSVTDVDQDELASVKTAAENLRFLGKAFDMENVIKDATDGKRKWQNDAVYAGNSRAMLFGQIDRLLQEKKELGEDMYYEYVAENLGQKDSPELRKRIDDLIKSSRDDARTVRDFRDKYGLNASNFEQGQKVLDGKQAEKDLTDLAKALGVPELMKAQPGSPEFDANDPEMRKQLLAVMPALIDKLREGMEQKEGETPEQNFERMKQYVGPKMLANLGRENNAANIDEMLRLVMQAEANVKAMDEAPKPPPETRVEKVWRPVDDKGNIRTDVKPDERLKNLESALKVLVPIMNGMNPDAKIGMPGEVDGYLDKATYDSFDKVYNGLQGYAKDNKLPLQVVAFMGLTKAISDKQKELDDATDSATKDKLKQDIIALNETKETLPQLLKDIEAMRADGTLDASKVVKMEQFDLEVEVKEPAKKPEDEPDIEDIRAKNEADQTENDIKIVEGALMAISGEMGGMGGDGGMLSKLFKPSVTELTQADIDEPGFGSKSQEVFAQVMMGFKSMTGAPDPDGTYSPEVGQKLKRAILTSNEPIFAKAREHLGIPQAMDKATENDYFGAKPSALASDEEKKAYQDKIDKANKLFKTQKLDEFIASLDRLHRKNVLDSNGRAKDVNGNSMMMDGIGSFLQENAPGLLGGIKDFFKNSDFGKMIAGFLALMGFNVGRLWGEKNDSEARQNARPAIEKGFDNAYDEAEAKLKDELGKDPEFDQIMGQVEKDMLGKMDSMKFKAAMSVMFRGKDKEFVKEAVKEALEAAKAASNKADARQAFTDSLMAKANKYSADNKADVKRASEMLEEATRGIKKAVEDDPSLGPQPSGLGDKGIGAQPTGLGSKGRGPNPEGSKTVDGALGKGSVDPKEAVLAMMAKNLGLPNTEANRADMQKLFNDLDENIRIASSGGRDFDAMGPTEEVNRLAKALGVDISKTQDYDEVRAKIRGAAFGELEKRGALIGNGFFNPDNNNQEELREAYLAYQAANHFEIPSDIPLFFTKDNDPSNSVYALVRVKGDGIADGTVTDDKYVVVKQEGYLNEDGRKVDNVEFRKALLKNYKWDEKSAKGIEKAINGALDLKPVQNTPDAKSAFNTAAIRRVQPTAFTQLQRMTQSQADWLVGKDGLNMEGRRPDLVEGIGENQKLSESLTDLLEEAVTAQGQRSNFVVLDLEDFGLKNREFDAVVAMRLNGKLEIRTINYNLDNIMPLSMQGKLGAAELKDKTASLSGAAVGGRRLDETILRVIHREADGTVKTGNTGASGGYMNSYAIVPGADKTGTKVVSGLEGVYGKELAGDKKNQGAYIDGYGARRAAVEKEEVEQAARRTSAGMRSIMQARFKEQSKPDETVASAIDTNKRDMGADRELAEGIPGNVLSGPGFRVGAGGAAA